MKDTWFTSDQHFGHGNILTFTGSDGKLIRPGFVDVDHMDEHMIARWNERVKPGDKVYHLGDFAHSKKYRGNFPKLVSRLHGIKSWIPGNHDEIKLWVAHFQKTRIWRIFKEEGFVATHVPIRIEQFRHKVLVNVHGHLHQNVINDPHYYNVCVELHDYYPVHMDTLIAYVNKVRQMMENKA